VDAETPYVWGTKEDSVHLNGHCVKEDIINAWTIDQVEIGTDPELKNRDQFMADLCQFKTPQMNKGSNSTNGTTKTAARKQEIEWRAHDAEYLVHYLGIMAFKEMKDIHSSNGLERLKDCG
jgi:hypothetical protein